MWLFLCRNYGFICVGEAQALLSVANAKAKAIDIIALSISQNVIYVMELIY